MNIRVQCFVLLCVLVCAGAVIKDLEDADYNRMPPLYGLDDYTTCLKQKNGMYCMAFFNLYSDGPNDLITLIQDYSAYDLTHFNHSYIQRGICVSKTCQNYGQYNEQDLSGILAACLNDSVTREYGIHAKLSAILYCDKPNETNSIQYLDWIVVAAIAAIVLLNVIGSLRENQNYQDPKRHGNADTNGSLWSHFALQNNWKHLTNIETTNLECLHGLRSIGMFLIIFGHVMWLVEFGFNDNPHDFEKGYNSAFFLMIFNGMMLVQVFFVMSGFLLMLRCLQFSEQIKITWKMYPLFILLRWIRLAPASMVSLAFSATWFRFLGSGPLWKMYIQGGVVADCRRYWWLHLLQINNYVPDDRFCELHTWYLAADFQLYVVGLAVIIATQARRRRAGLLALLLLGAGAAMLHVWLRGMDGLLLLTPEFHRTFKDENYHFMHVLGHVNLPAYVVGMAAGSVAYSAYRYNEKPKFSKCLRVTAWLALPLGLGIVLSGAVFYSGAREWLALRLLYAATHRAALGAVVAASILGSVYKWNDPVLRLLSWRGWAVPSRLSYCAFLVHVNIILLLVASKTQLAHFDAVTLMVSHLGVVWLSLLLALPLHLLVEQPFKRLVTSIVISNFFDTKKKEKNT